jgi:hypothetical protein
MGDPVSSRLPSFQEFKVYDDTRHPRDWNALLAPAQCAVFFKDAENSCPLSPAGAVIPRFRDCTFLRFDSAEEARQFCEAKVRQFPRMSCEVFDYEGRAKPPLFVVVHPSAAGDDDLSGTSVHRRKIAAIACFIGAVPLFVWDWRARGALILPTFFGINMILFGLRLLYWNMDAKERAAESERRLQIHRLREKASTRNAKTVD